MANSPGLLVSGTVIGPLATTGRLVDSVDGDDGLIDGNGAAGHSLLAETTIVLPTDPPSFRTSIGVPFDASELIRLPTYFGFVFTDGPELTGLQILAFDVDDNQIENIGFGSIAQDPNGLGDDRRDGTTAEDRFIGLFSTTGIARVNITAFYRNDGVASTFEVDHIQYGVPEPAGFVIAFGSLCVLGCCFRCRR